MASDRTSFDKPPALKRFVTVREINELADAGTRELVTGENVVITDAAREAASDLGIRLVSQGKETKAAAPSAGAPDPPTPDAAIVEAIVGAFRHAGQLQPSESEVREVTMRILSADGGRTPGRR